MTVDNSPRYLGAVSGRLDETTVGLFPGQGAISHGAGAEWTTHDGWSIVERISSVTGVDVAHLLLEMADDELVRTDRAQLATFALGLVGWHDVVASGKPLPQYLVGHSLGEFTALVAAGVVFVDDGARLVAARGAAMAAASAQAPGTMVALMGPGEGAVERLASAPGVFVANFNGPGQVVVSGDPEAMADVVARSRELGWRRATPLTVGGAFHSPLMASAQAALDDALAATTFHPTDHLVGANADGAWHGGGADWRARLSAQLVSPVRFDALIETLPDPVTTAVEAPPAGVLIGLAKRIRPFATLREISPNGATGG